MIMKDLLLSCDLVLIFERSHYNIEVYRHIENMIWFIHRKYYVNHFTIFNKKASIHYT